MSRSAERPDKLWVSDNGDVVNLEHVITATWENTHERHLRVTTVGGDSFRIPFTMCERFLGAWKAWSLW